MISRSVEKRLNVLLKEKMDRLKADLIRETGILERHCDRGIGHPVGHVRGFLYDYETIHGCSGGCAGWVTQEVRKAPSSKE